MSELFRALGALVEPPHPKLERIAAALELGPLPTRAEHAEAFLFSLYPYASVYLGAEGKMGGEARDRIAGFFRAIGAPVTAEPDHVATLLASYAALSEREDLAHVRKALFWEHLASFLPAYASAMQELGIDFYVRWAELLSEAVRDEAEELGPPDRMPLHFAESAPLSVSETTTLPELLDGLLAPARSGVILVRRDLARAARSLGIALRPGERRWALTALLAQDAPGTLAWLSREARIWAARHTNVPLCTVWAKRALRTAEVTSSQTKRTREANYVVSF